MFILSLLVESVSIDNEYDYENEILPLTIMRMRFENIVTRSKEMCGVK